MNSYKTHWDFMSISKLLCHTREVVKKSSPYSQYMRCDSWFCIHHIKRTNSALARVAQLVGHCPLH